MPDQPNAGTPVEPAAPVPKKPRVVSGKQAKRKKFYLLKIDDESAFRLRRADLPTLFFEGLLPTPILRAVDGFQKMRSAMQGDEIADALSAISKEERETFMELLRRAAVAVVVTPKLTHSKKASLENDELLWVGGISDVEGENDPSKPTEEQPGDVPLPVLMQIWKAVLGEAGIIVMPDDEAESFRESKPELPVPPVPDVGGVRTEAVVVDAHEPVTAGAVQEPTRKVRFLAHE